MKKKIIERRARTPTWIRNPVEAELVRQIHDQWCADHGSGNTATGSNVSEIRQKDTLKVRHLGVSQRCLFALFRTHLIQ